MANDRCGRLSLSAQPGKGGLVRENSRGGWLRLVVGELASEQQPYATVPMRSGSQ
jgi:hypothetical protein